MLIVRAGLVILSALATAQPALAREAVVLHASSKWVLDYAEENCRLARSFGTGSQQINLVLDQFSPGEWFRLTMSGQVFAQENFLRSSKPQIRFGPNEKPSPAEGFAALIGKTPAFVAGTALRVAPYTEAEEKAFVEAVRTGKAFDSAPIAPEREAAATSLEITNLLRSADFILETGSMGKPLAALRQCSWDTVRSWGLDVEQQKNLSRRAQTKKPAGSWFSPDDYPSKMLEQKAQADVNFRVIVDEKGAPISCTIQRSTRPKDFDDLVCRIIMKRARFVPALDASGTPVKSFYSQRVTWRIQ